MAKKDKRLGDDPFERFLPQIQDSRKKKDADTSDDESTIADVSKSTDTGTSKSASKRTSKIAGNDNGASVSKSTDANEGASKSTSISNGNGTGKSVGEIAVADKITSNDTSAVASNGAITIARRKKTNTLVKMTHYFRPDQLQAIDELHEKSGRDKSELVRMAIDILIERARVE